MAFMLQMVTTLPMILNPYSMSSGVSVILVARVVTHDHKATPRTLDSFDEKVVVEHVGKTASVYARLALMSTITKSPSLKVGSIESPLMEIMFSAFLFAEPQNLEIH